MFLKLLFIMVSLIDSGWLASPLATAVRLSENSAQPFLYGPHLKLISDAIVNAVHGLGPRFVAVSMPPQHGKSEMISRRSCEWYLGNWPHRTVAVGGYGDDFVKRWGRTVRNDIESHEELFGFTISDDSSAANQWSTSMGGGMWATGMLGQAPGKPAHFIVVDDPMKGHEDAYSPTMRDKVYDNFVGSFLTRLHERTAVIVVSTRWHEDDLIGRLLDGEHGDASLWLELRLPAIWEQDEPYVYPTGEIRRKGEALFPALHSAEKILLQKNAAQSEEIWQAVYQQVPRGRTGLGRVYDSYNEGSLYESEYDPSASLFVACDFNVDPMSWVIGQVREYFAPRAYVTNEKVVQIEVLDELSIPNTTTEKCCNTLHGMLQELTRGAKITVDLYGDAAGGQRHSSSEKSDWEILKAFFARETSRYALHYHVPSKNPAVRDRVNAMNSAFKTAGGVRRMTIHPRCKQLRLDLEKLIWKRDSNNRATDQIDESDDKRKHMSDALGYMVYTKFGYHAGGGERAGGIMR